MCMDRSDVAGWGGAPLGRGFCKSSAPLPCSNPTRCNNVFSRNAWSQGAFKDEALNLCCWKNSMCFLDVGRFFSFCYYFITQNQFFQPCLTTDSSYQVRASSYCFQVLSAECCYSFQWQASSFGRTQRSHPLTTFIPQTNGSSTSRLPLPKGNWGRISTK